ncbi:MAG: DUF2029 domain-containing protein [Chloroflexota bacterium]|nr:DUF2029 domain-containing protein [Chloroflexota bacterium]
MRRLAAGLLGLVLLLGTVAVWTVPGIDYALLRVNSHTEGGNYSDFDQLWVATRAVLFDHANPYTLEIRDRIQVPFYGHVLRADDPHRPKLLQGFYYPLYIVWLVWPLALLPLPVAVLVFQWCLAALLVAGMWAYLTLLGWPAGPRYRLAAAAGILLTLGAQAVVHFAQPTGLFFGLLLGAFYAASRDRPRLVGVLLALTLIKPQLALPPALGLMLWSWQQPTRRQFVGAALATGAALLGSSLLLFPGWPLAWIGSFATYAATGATPATGLPLDAWIGGLLRVGLALLVLPLWWAVRRLPWRDRRVPAALAITLVLTLAVQQPWFDYNLVLLYPALLTLPAALQRSQLTIPAPAPLLSRIALATFSTSWLVALGLLVVYLLHWLPLTASGWPSYVVLSTLVHWLVSNAIVLTALCACLAWLPALLRPAPAANRV